MALKFVTSFSLLEECGNKDKPKKLQGIFISVNLLENHWKIPLPGVSTKFSIT
jgi:hypothetical protein